jgi:hypothetical protein
LDAPCLIDAADIPVAAVDGVVRPVLVDPGAEAGRAELEGHFKGLVGPVVAGTAAPLGREVDYQARRPSVRRQIKWPRDL